MIVLDFKCPKCDKIKEDVIVENSKEIIFCACGEKMMRQWTSHKYNRRPKSDKEYPKHNLKSGERVGFGKHF